MGFKFLNIFKDKKKKLDNTLSKILSSDYVDCEILNISYSDVSTNYNWNHDLDYSNRGNTANIELSLNINNLFPNGEIIIGKDIYKKSFIKDCRFSINISIGNTNNTIDLIDHVYVTRSVNYEIYKNLNIQYNSDHYIDYNNKIITTLPIDVNHKIRYKRIFLDSRDFEHILSEICSFIKESIINQFIDEVEQTEKLIRIRNKIKKFNELINADTIKDYFCTTLDYLEDYDISYEISEKTSECRYTLLISAYKMNNHLNDHSTAGYYSGFIMDINDKNSNVIRINRINI